MNAYNNRPMVYLCTERSDFTYECYDIYADYAEYVGAMGVLVSWWPDTNQARIEANSVVLLPYYMDYNEHISMSYFYSRQMGNAIVFDRSLPG